MEFYCTKVDGVLVGADSDSEEKLANIGTDTLVTCKTSKKRNGKNHSRFFVFRDAAFDMQSRNPDKNAFRFTDKEAFRKWLTMKAGYYDHFIAPNGTHVYTPKSLAFAGDLDEEDFKVFFSKCITTFTNEFNLETDDQFWEIVGFD